ncbi:hypothetical protein NL676_030055 [Syzygium grande]|nr:hypothetical protein NL676_030055 [Syzygium grande]
MNTTNAIDDGAKLERTVTIPELSKAEQSARLEEEEAMKRFGASLMSPARKYYDALKVPEADTEEQSHHHKNKKIETGTEKEQKSNQAHLPSRDFELDAWEGMTMTVDQGRWRKSNWGGHEIC